MTTIAAINKAIRADGNKLVKLVTGDRNTVFLMNYKGRSSSGAYPRSDVKEVPLLKWQVRATMFGMGS